MASYSDEIKFPKIRCKKCKSFYTPVQHKTRKILTSIRFTCSNCRTVFNYHNWPCLLIYIASTGAITFFLMQYLFHAFVTGEFTYLVTQDTRNFSFVFTRNIKEKFIILAAFLIFLLTIIRFMVHFRELVKRALNIFLETEPHIR